MRASADIELSLQAADKALNWCLDEPLSPFDGKTAESLVKEEDGGRNTPYSFIQCRCLGLKIASPIGLLLAETRRGEPR